MSNWFTKATDAVVSFFSPQKAAQRVAWREVQRELEGRSSYDAGHDGRFNRNWTVTNTSADMTDRYDRDIVRARARDLERNSDILNSLIWARVRNVVGSGFVLQAQTNSDTLNETLERLWQKWCKAENCDVTGTQTLTQMLRMIVTRKMVDGGILIVKRTTRDGIIPFSLQLIEVDELDDMQIQPRQKSNRVVGGIEYNAYNRPQGYWVRQYGLDGFSLRAPIYIPAQDAIFYFKKRRPSQIREMSDVAPTLSRIRDANEFMTSVAMKQRVEACLSVFIKRALPQTGLGRGGYNAEQKSYQGKHLEPATIVELNAGDDVSVVNPSGQATDAASIMKLHEKTIAAGQGLSYESTSRDMSETNYASARQSAIEDELTFAEERESLRALLDDIYSTFVLHCALAGLVNIPNVAQNLDEYTKHEWSYPPKPWVDPYKEANATKVALSSGIKTYQQICAENGADWRDNLEAIAESLEYAEDLGLNIGGVLYDGKLTGGGETVQQSGSSGGANAPRLPNASDGNADSDSNGTNNEGG